MLGGPAMFDAAGTREHLGLSLAESSSFKPADTIILPCSVRAFALISECLVASSSMMQTVSSLRCMHYKVKTRRGHLQL